MHAQQLIKFVDLRNIDEPFQDATLSISATGSWDSQNTIKFGVTIAQKHLPTTRDTTAGLEDDERYNR